jgi:hypothetical protein
MAAGLERAQSGEAAMNAEEVVETLQWMSAVNYVAAVQLTRMRKAGVDLRREDGRNLDLWTAEQVRMARIAEQVRTEFEGRADLLR